MFPNPLKSASKQVTTGAILCGGKSSRMGVSKTAVRLSSGMTMIEHVYLALSQVCERIVFVGHARGISPALLKRGVHVNDEIPDLGPLGALDALLSSGIDERYLVTPCDLFRATPALFRLLKGDRRGRPLLLRHAGVIEPLIGVYPADLLPVLRRQLAQRRLSVRELINAGEPGYVEVPGHLAEALSNANSPHDLDHYPELTGGSA